VVLPSSILRIPNICSFEELAEEEEDLKEDLREGIQDALESATATMDVPFRATVGRMTLRPTKDSVTLFVEIDRGNWLLFDLLHKALFRRLFNGNMLIPTFFPQRHWKQMILY